MNVYVLQEIVHDEGCEDYGIWVFDSINDAVLHLNRRVKKMKELYSISENDRDYDFESSNEYWECWLPNRWGDFHISIKIFVRDVR